MIVEARTGSASYAAASTGAYQKTQPARGDGAAAHAAATDSATVVTVSEAARAAYAAASASSDEGAGSEEGTEPDFAAVVQQARGLLNELLEEAERASPLEEGRLALDMSRFDERALHAVAVTDDGLFTSDERQAASLELARRFELAMSGPAAVSRVTGDYRTVYRAAADYLDGQSDEQKAVPAWQQARDAVAAALEVLESDPSTPPQDIADDPVAAYLSSAGEAPESDEEPVGDTLAQNLRIALDRRYREAEEQGLRPTLTPTSAVGYYNIDLAEYDSRAVSAMAIDAEGLFSTDEIRAASADIRARSKTALSSAYEDAGRTGDPTAFSQNIMALYNSMTIEERQAAGWSEDLFNSAVASYETTSMLLSALSGGGGGRGGGGGSGGIASWFSG